LSFTVQYWGFTVSLIDIVLVEQCANCRTKEAVSRCGKSLGIVVSLSSKNGTKVAKLEKDFDILTTTLTAVTKNGD